MGIIIFDPNPLADAVLPLTPRVSSSPHLSIFRRRRAGKEEIPVLPPDAGKTVHFHPYLFV
jgi:hypothetical protein